MTSDFTPFTVRAPASTANFGSAFDAVGMALDLWLELRVEPADANRFEIRGEGENEISGPANSNLIFRAAYIGAARLGATLPPLRIAASNAIPLARGLGSSAAACAAGLLIANTVVGRDSGMDNMIADATRIEGHPDNVAPALMGGACLAVMSEDGRPVARQLDFPDDLDCVAFVRDAPLSTEAARNVLPPQVPLSDATFNIARTALLVHTFTTHHWVDLALATEDRLHQQYRAELVPGLTPLTHAAKEAGAYTAFLSGAGPTIMAMSSSARAGGVADAMNSAAQSRAIEGRVLALSPSGQGAHVVSAS